MVLTLLGSGILVMLVLLDRYFLSVRSLRQRWSAQLGTKLACTPILSLLLLGALLCGTVWTLMSRRSAPPAVAPALSADTRTAPVDLRGQLVTLLQQFNAASINASAANDPSMLRELK